jgi:CRP-like cAMP-binding protein
MQFSLNWHFIERLRRKRLIEEKDAHDITCSLMQFESFKKGQTIYTENDRPEKVFMIISGKVNIYKLKSRE